MVTAALGPVVGAGFSVCWGVSSVHQHVVYAMGPVLAGGEGRARVYSRSPRGRESVRVGGPIGGVQDLGVDSFVAM